MGAAAAAVAGDPARDGGAAAAAGGDARGAAAAARGAADGAAGRCRQAAACRPAGPENNRFRAATRDTGNRMPAYPREAALKFESGTVKLQLFVDAGGQVANVLVMRSSGSAALDRAAREQAMTWHFAPARRDGKAVADLWRSRSSSN